MAVAGVNVLGPRNGQFNEILTDDALRFLAALHRTFDATRQSLLIARIAVQQRLDAGQYTDLDFPPETAHIRADPSWLCAPPAPGLEDRRVEITGPTDRKMVVNALNSGAKTFMADFEGEYHAHPCLRVQVTNDAHLRLKRTELEQSRHWAGQLTRRHSPQDRLRAGRQVVQAQRQARRAHRQVRPDALARRAGYTLTSGAQTPWLAPRRASCDRRQPDHVRRAL